MIHDPELKAMAEVFDALKGLDADTQKRVADWVLNKLRTAGGAAAAPKTRRGRKPGAAKKSAKKATRKTAKKAAKKSAKKAVKKAAKKAVKKTAKKAGAKRGRPAKKVAAKKTPGRRGRPPGSGKKKTAAAPEQAG